MRALLVGLLLSLAGFAHRAATPLLPPPGPGPAAWWVADRGGDRVLSLDAELLIRRVVEVRAPVLVAAAPAGGAWVVSARAARRNGPHRLLRIDAAGRRRREWGIPPALALGTARSAAFLLTERGVLARFDEAGPSLLAQVPGARALLVRPGELVVADEAGQILSFDPQRGSGRVLATLDPPAVDLAPGRGAGLRVLDEAGALLDVIAGRAVRGARHGLERPRFAPGAGPDLVWLIDRERGAVQRVVPWGPRRTWSAIAGFESAHTTGDGGLLALAADGLHGLGPDGRRRLGQGGFGFAVSVVPASTSGRR